MVVEVALRVVENAYPVGEHQLEVANWGVSTSGKYTSVTIPPATVNQTWLADEYAVPTASLSARVHVMPAPGPPGAGFWSRSSP